MLSVYESDSYIYFRCPVHEISSHDARLVGHVDLAGDMFDILSHITLDFPRHRSIRSMALPDRSDLTSIGGLEAIDRLYIHTQCIWAVDLIVCGLARCNRQPLNVFRWKLDWAVDGM